MSRLVIKIGGSFLTKKARSGNFPETIDRIQSDGARFIENERLKSISEEIREVKRKNHVMVTHGAGPFGHALVEKIFSGAPIDVLDVHRSMLVLNDAVRLSLQTQGLDCITLSPLDFVEYDGEFRTGKLVSSMEKEASSGRLPISHGDIVRATTSPGRLGNYEVISGDVVARDLAVDWRADSVIMITDTDGILDRDPALGKGRRIPNIGYQSCLDLLSGRGGKGADVTGGIAQKVVCCQEPILMGIPLKIISGVEPGQLTSASEDEDVGTTIDSG